MERRLNGDLEIEELYVAVLKFVGTTTIGNHAARTVTPNNGAACFVPTADQATTAEDGSS